MDKYIALAGIDFKSCEKHGKVKYCSGCSEYRQRVCEAEVNGTEPPAKQTPTQRINEYNALRVQNKLH